MVLPRSLVGSWWRRRTTPCSARKVGRAGGVRQCHRDVGQGHLATGHESHQARGVEDQGLMRLLAETPQHSLEPMEGQSRKGWTRVPWGQARRSWAFPLLLPSIPTVTEEISLEVPANILEGSQRAHVTVIGKRQAGDRGPPAAGMVQSSMAQAQQEMGPPGAEMGYRGHS